MVRFLVDARPSTVLLPPSRLMLPPNRDQYKQDQRTISSMATAGLTKNGLDSKSVAGRENTEC